MITRRAHNLLSFFKRSVEEEGEKLKEARKFVESLPDLTRAEQLQLTCALSSRAHLRDFCNAYRA
jgi:hypothetical protein